MSEEKKLNIDEFHHYGALDRASLFATLVEQQLLDEPFVKMVPEIYELIEKSVELLNEAYMKIGAYEIVDGNWYNNNKN